MGEAHSTRGTRERDREDGQSLPTAQICKRKSVPLHTALFGPLDLGDVPGAVGPSRLFDEKSKAQGPAALVPRARTGSEDEQAYCACLFVTRLPHHSLSLVPGPTPAPQGPLASLLLPLCHQHPVRSGRA